MKRSLHRHRMDRQRGVALVGALTVFVMLLLHGLVSQLNAATTRLPAVREAAGRTSLAQARASLIAFAAENRNRPGGLPCPDRNGDGEAEMSCDSPATRIGWLPWQTLALGDPRDARGERLRYALAERYRNDADMVINVTTPGQPLAALLGTPASDSSTPTVDDVAAVVFSADRASVEPLAANELWRYVQRIVGHRIEREIAPLLEREYVAAWHALPYAAPFADPQDPSPIAGDPHDRAEGGLPLTRDPLWAAWNRATVQVQAIGGVGTLHDADCSTSVATEIRCELRYDGEPVVRVRAVANNVGRALVALPSALEVDDFGPATLERRRIVLERLGRDGHAVIDATATLPRFGNAVRIHLHAPRYLRPLVDRSLPVAAPGSWFARNEWGRFVYYAASPDALPGRALRPCALVNRCPVLATARDALPAPAILVFTGRAGVGASPIERYLEGDNASPDDGRFERAPTTGAANDRAFALCVEAGATRCGVGS